MFPWYILPSPKNLWLKNLFYFSPVVNDTSLPRDDLQSESILWCNFWATHSYITTGKKEKKKVLLRL